MAAEPVSVRMQCGSFLPRSSMNLVGMQGRREPPQFYRTFYIFTAVGLEW